MLFKSSIKDRQTLNDLISMYNLNKELREAEGRMVFARGYRK